MSRPRKGYPDDAVVAGATMGSSDGTFDIVSIIMFLHIEYMSRVDLSFKL